MSCQDPHNADFWGALGGEVEVTAEGAPDDNGEGEHSKAPYTLSRVSDAGGALEVTEVASGGALERALLDGKDVFVLDAGTAVYVWVGKATSDEEKKQGVAVASKFVQQSGRPAHTPITRVFEGAETTAFKVRRVARGVGGAGQQPPVVNTVAPRLTHWICDPCVVVWLCAKRCSRASRSGRPSSLPPWASPPA
jgi:hypothetical protein